MKPLVRWILGPCKSDGVDCLILSIRNWRKLYGDSWDYALCYNDSKPKNIPDYVHIIDQKNFIQSLPIPPTGPAWKLYPPRLRLKAPEIILDNDFLLFNSHPFIDRFLNEQCFLTTESLRRCYGNFDHIIADNSLVNTGLIGLPPNFDMQKRLVEILKFNNVKKWETHFCEQGVVAFILMSGKHLKISRKEISIGFYEEPYYSGSHGIHFVGLNGGWSGWWNSYLQGILL